MKSLYYAGIGSRQTPSDILQEMEVFAEDLECIGYTLRSGGAKGADQAFERGVNNPKNKEIFYANDATPDAMYHACKYHPRWTALSSYGQLLMGRNSMILLGKDLKTPVEFVLCWTPNGEVTGGTGQGLRIALDLDIPIYNLARDDWYNEFWGRNEWNVGPF